MNAPYDTDHRFQSDGRSPYCRECELLSWMHDGPRTPAESNEREEKG